MPPKQGLQIFSCFSTAIGPKDYLECTRHAVLAYGCLAMLGVFSCLLIKLNRRKNLKKKIDATKNYLLITLIIFDTLNFLHFGVFLDDQNEISTLLKKILTIKIFIKKIYLQENFLQLKANLQILIKIVFTMAIFLLFQYFF